MNSERASEIFWFGGKVIWYDIRGGKDDITKYGRDKQLISIYENIGAGANTFYMTNTEKERYRSHGTDRRDLLLYVRFLFWKDMEMVEKDMICEEGEFIKDGVKIKRQKCLIYTRVMGYFRPVQAYNPGKKSEFYSRKYFSEGIIASNRDFNTKYGDGK